MRTDLGLEQPLVDGRVHTGLNGRDERAQAWSGASMLSRKNTPSV
jgi:hypothetical protein